ncbi:hypothetical protein [Streptomyces iconiensis]|uniref:WXG100 family type VII secretion target n=1 Tax=Streptomyces iconiensis TaxID=1384038 RepID=A0ABT7A416_9ACTN|nr:hypothetical protein [Streptomyces iconiensis]MDJ1136088.1 hypothetical protein [Streptomyces iconiensis]
MAEGGEQSQGLTVPEGVLSSPGAELKVPESTVKGLTKGIRGVLNELREVGTDVDAAQGSGFNEMSLTKMEVGDDALSESFEGFCEQWEWGVRGLMAEADAIAEQLGLSAGMTWEEDRYRSIAINGTVNALTPAGNPYASEDGLADVGIGGALIGRSEGKPGEGGEPGGAGETGSAGAAG